MAGLPAVDSVFVQVKPNAPTTPIARLRRCADRHHHQRLGNEGARVYLGDLNEEGVNGVAEQINATGGSAHAARFDLTDDASIGGSNSCKGSRPKRYGTLRIGGLRLVPADSPRPERPGETVEALGAIASQVVEAADGYRQSHGPTA